jgi:hypothetical protein
MKAQYPEAKLSVTKKGFVVLATETSQSALARRKPGQRWTPAEMTVTLCEGGGSPDTI